MTSESQQQTAEVMETIGVKAPARITIPGWAFWGKVVSMGDADEFAAFPRDGEPIAEMTIDTDAPILLHLSPQCELVDVTAIRDERRVYILTKKGSA